MIPTILLATALQIFAEPLPTDDGYRGIWYFNQPTSDEYRYKYSGGFATYPQQHAPIAIYCAEVEKTFFVYGGTTARALADPAHLRRLSVGAWERAHAFSREAHVARVEAVLLAAAGTKPVCHT